LEQWLWFPFGHWIVMADCLFSIAAWLGYRQNGTTWRMQSKLFDD
jgi:hypothetical protein